MNQETLDRFTSRKFIAFVVGLGAATIYALGYIDEKGLAAITGVVAAYNVGEGLSDFGQSAAKATAVGRLEEAALFEAARRAE